MKRRIKKGAPINTTKLPSFDTAHCLGLDHVQDFINDPKAHLARSQKAAAQMDRFLDFQFAEDQVGSDFEGQTWSDLSPQIWQTPYNIMLEMLDLAQPSNTAHVVDLGAGYGRMGLVLAKHYPSCTFTGVEAVEVRVLEGLRMFKKYEVPHKLLIQDFNAPDFKIPRADLYFIYDSAQGEALRDLLVKLREAGKSAQFQVIARGGMIRSLIDHRHPWLSQVQAAQHFPHFSLYKN